MEEKNKTKTKTQTIYSLPSLRERSETPGALNRWESQETVAQEGYAEALAEHGRLLHITECIKLMSGYKNRMEKVNTIVYNSIHNPSPTYS